jgi:hypothetical protein
MRQVAKMWRRFSHIRGGGTTGIGDGGKTHHEVVVEAQVYHREGGVSLELLMMKKFSHQIRAKRKQKKKTQTVNQTNKFRLLQPQFCLKWRSY